MLATRFIKFNNTSSQRFVFNVDDIQSMHPLELTQGKKLRDQEYLLWVRGRADPIVLDAVYAAQVYNALPESKDITVPINARI